VAEVEENAEAKADADANADANAEVTANSASGSGATPPTPPDLAPSASQPDARTSTADPTSSFWTSLRRNVREYFFAEDPTISTALVPFCFLSMALFTRHPTKTNFIFDEQEALLANPYVRSVADPKSPLHWHHAFYRDFWGLPPERSIGSYRPIPDLIWRALWALGAREQTPFLHHWVNVLLHGINGALVTVIAMHLTKNRRTAWLSGLAFTACAVLTECVSGVVGLADVLGACGALFALYALRWKGPWMPLGVFGGVLFGLYSKESALACVPAIPVLVLLTSQIAHPEKPERWKRAAYSALAAGAAFILYVELRRRMFPAPLPQELSVEANADKPFLHRTFAAMMRWYAQPSLPRDPLNNPLVKAEMPKRLAGAFRVYARGLWQVIFPKTLSGDYSSPQEPIPDTIIFPESIVGALAMILPFPLAAWFGFRAWRDGNRAPDQKELGGPYRGVVVTEAQKLDLRPVAGALMVWVALFYFPVSNIPVLLPTVRAERFWYFPAIATAILIGMTLDMLLDETKKRVLYKRIAVGFIVFFFGFQFFSARRHANDYADDLVFWDATRHAVPNSAKAHLNYSVMKGARGDLEERLRGNAEALRLAPQWPMANIYYGDTLCRLHRAPEAIPYYERGFDLAYNDVNLIALALQCLWDEKELEPDKPLIKELGERASKFPSSWYDYLVRDIVLNGEEHKGVDPKHRPRGYNEGPKE
jgi:hypothetical protein